MIYVASKTKHGGMWQRVKKDLLPEIDADWIYISGDWEVTDWHEHWVNCISTAGTSFAVIAYREPGEQQKGALIEIGAALAHRVPVFLVGDWNRDEVGSWVDHHAVVKCSSMQMAVLLARQAVGDLNVFDRLIGEGCDASVV